MDSQKDEHGNPASQTVQMDDLEDKHGNPISHDQQQANLKNHAEQLNPNNEKFQEKKN